MPRRQKPNRPRHPAWSRSNKSKPPPGGLLRVAPVALMRQAKPTEKIMVNYTTIKKTYSRARRRKTAKQNEGCVTRMARTTGRRTHLAYEQDEISAHWLIDSAGRNKITLGQRFDETMTATSSINPRHLLDCYYSLCRHEACHGEYTGTAGETAARECARQKLPFAILNLFEDCRIEHLSRDATGKKFRWSNWLEIPEVIDRASNWLWVMKVREASSMSSISAAMAPVTWMGSTWTDGKKTTRIIADFYQRIIRVGDTSALVPLVKEWCDLFGYDKPDTPHVTDKTGNESDPNHGGDDEGEPGVGKGSKGEGISSKLADAQSLEKLVDAGVISREVDSNYFQ